MKGRYLYFIRFLLLLFFVSACSGYHFNSNNNPLIGYDIKTIAIPMFINRSVFPQLAAPMTKEISLTLGSFSGLKVINGDNENADAVLIGILESKDHYNDALRTTQTVFTDKDILNSIGNRSPFYYPVQSAFDFSLKFILLKRPSREEIQFLANAPKGSVLIHPKIVIQDTINLTGTFSRVISPTSTSGSPGEVNFVKNNAILVKSLQETCYRAAQTFRQVVLNAF